MSKQSNGLSRSGMMLALGALSAVLAGGVSVANAQFIKAEDKAKKDAIKPPTINPNTAQGAPSLMVTIGMVGLAALVVGVNFLPTKRSHQD